MLALASERLVEMLGTKGSVCVVLLYFCPFVECFGTTAEEDAVKRGPVDEHELGRNAYFTSRIMHPCGISAMLF
jgi:hypothetical protein